MRVLHSQASFCTRLSYSLSIDKNKTDQIKVKTVSTY